MALHEAAQQALAAAMALAPPEHIAGAVWLLGLAEHPLAHTPGHTGPRLQELWQAEPGQAEALVAACGGPLLALWTLRGELEARVEQLHHLAEADDEWVDVETAAYMHGVVHHAIRCWP